MYNAGENKWVWLGCTPEWLEAQGCSLLEGMGSAEQRSEGEVELPDQELEGDGPALLGEVMLQHSAVHLQPLTLATARGQHQVVS